MEDFVTDKELSPKALHRSRKRRRRGGAQQTDEETSRKTITDKDIAEFAPPKVNPPPTKVKPMDGIPQSKRPNWAKTLPEPPFTLLLIAPRKSGKTTVINSLINELLFDFKEPKSPGEPMRKGKYWDHIVYVSPTATRDKSIDLKRVDVVYEDYNDVIIKRITKYAMDHDAKKKILLILDDCVGLIAKYHNSQIAPFTTRNRHYGISIMITTQRLKGMPPVIREQSCAMVIFKLNSELEREHLRSEIPYFELYYDKAIGDGESYNFLYIKKEGGVFYYFQNFDTLLGKH